MDLQILPKYISFFSDLLHTQTTYVYVSELLPIWRHKLSAAAIMVAISGLHPIDARVFTDARALK